MLVAGTKCGSVSLLALDCLFILLLVYICTTPILDLCVHGRWQRK